MADIGKWNDRYFDLVYRLAMLGATERVMAMSCGVSVATIAKWKRENPEFNLAIMKGTTEEDMNLVEVLHRAAKGYEREEEVVTNYKGEITVTKVKKYYKPDTWALLKILALKERAMWSETQRIDITNNINITKLDLSGYTTEELAMIDKLALKQKQGALPEYRGEENGDR
jgi:hypothetical protein